MKRNPAASEPAGRAASFNCSLNRLFIDCQEVSLKIWVSKEALICALATTRASRRARFLPRSEAPPAGPSSKTSARALIEGLKRL